VSQLGSVTVKDFFQRYAAQHASFFFKFALTNLWITEPIVKLIFSADSETDAIQRTTTALTVVNAGFKENVVPAKANAVVNHRIHPADDVDEVLRRDADFMGDERVQVSPRVASRRNDPCYVCQVTLRDYFEPP